MNFWNTIRKIERIGFYAGMLLVGLLFVAASCVILSLPKTERVSTEGMIQHISYDPSSEVETVYVCYTDGEGDDHEMIPYPLYTSSMKVGQTVEVLYDPASPEDIEAPGGGFIPYLILAVGILAIGASIYMIIAGARRAEGNSPFESTAPRPVDPFLAEQIRNDGEPTQNYYFHWTGKLNQSYILETPERQAIYEAICDHIGFFKPYRYTFANRITGVSREHIISHTVTTRYGHGSGDVSFSAVSSSRFKIDGENNWDHLGRLGYSVEPKVCGIRVDFEVLRYGVPVAYLEAAGVNILKDGADSRLGEVLPATGLYKVSCRESDLEGVFFACFCVSRVEFF